jgi:hypothetical protein
MKEKLNNVLEEIEAVLGDYAPVIETNCPAWALSLKEAEGKIIEAIEKTDFGDENARLERLWQEFISWDNNNGTNGANDDEAERYAKCKGAVGYQTIAFMAFVAGCSRTEKETGK